MSSLGMEREEQPGGNERVKITRAAFDGLEFIRRSGATNMLDRPTVLALAEEWGFPETADWIASVDNGTYGRLILEGHQLIDSDPMPDLIARDVIDQPNQVAILYQEIEDQRFRMREIIATLGRQAVLTLADTYETDVMGVLIDSPNEPRIATERMALIRSLGETSGLWLRLDASLSEAMRGIGSLQYLIDPENT